MLAFLALIRRGVAQTLASELVIRSLIWGGALLTGGSSVLFPGPRLILIGASLTLVVTGLIASANRWWEYRFEPFALSALHEKVHLAEGGRLVKFTYMVRIRSRRAGLPDFDWRLGWTGETRIEDAFRLAGRGFSVQPERQNDYVNFKFIFDEPVKRSRSFEVGLELTLNEPSRSYSPHLGVSTSNYMWTILSELRWELTWDDDVNIREGSIEVSEYRHMLDRTVRRRAPFKKWRGKDLRATEDGQGITWKKRPVPGNRDYQLKFAKPN